MTNDEIRKLIAGYATNTLTEAERKSLFEAALDDQELFDTLQNEQALKDFLADPVSRAQVQQALRTERTAWWSRWWAWGSAASAIAATVLIVAVVNQGPHPSAPATVPASPQVAMETPPARAKEAEPKPSLDQAREQLARIPRIARKGARRALKAILPESDKEARKDQKQEVAAAPPPPPPPTAETAPPSKTDLVQSAPAQVAQQNQSTTHDQLQRPAAAAPKAAQTQAQASSTSFRDTDAGTRAYFAQQAVGGYAPNSLFRFSLLKRNDSGAYVPVAANELHNGDAIRLSVFPLTQGYLSLSHFENGLPIRIFPASGSGIPVAANANYTIPPDASIQVTDKEQKLRVTLLPQIVVNTNAFETRRMAKESAKTAKVSPSSAKPMPPFVDITIPAGR